MVTELRRNPNYKAHADDEGIDRIEIVATPRYKTSGLSGNEWRVGATIRFYRKGQQIYDEFRTNMAAAVRHLPYLLDQAPERSERALWGLDEAECHQFGCAEPATVILRLKSEYGRQGEGPLPDHGIWEHRRAFCARHARRGDCGLEDADSNYEVVSGRAEPQADDDSPSAFGGVITLDQHSDQQREDV